MEETAMAKNDFEIPGDMRAFAEKSVEQARQAFDTFINAAHQAAANFEGQAASAQKGVLAVSEKAVAFAEQNMAASFDYAQKLVRAKDAQEVMRLHAEYVQAQMAALAEQARELGQTATRAASEVAKPRR
jgi:phasin